MVMNKDHAKEKHRIQCENYNLRRRMADVLKESKRHKKEITE